MPENPRCCTNMATELVESIVSLMYDFEHQKITRREYIKGLLAIHPTFANLIT